MSGMLMESAMELPQDQMETPPALQRLWARRTTITSPLPEESDFGVLEDLFPPGQVNIYFRYCRRVYLET